MLRAEVLQIMLFSCVTWKPRACHYDMLRRAHHSFLTRYINSRKNNRTDHTISYQDTHKKVGSEIEVGDVRKTDGGRELRGGGGKRVDEVFPGRLQSFRYQRQPVDGRAWRMTA